MRARLPYRFFAIAALLVIVCVQTADAQRTRMGLHAGLNLDRSDFFLGLNGHLGVTISDKDAILAVTAELYPFLDQASVTMVELNALLPGHFFGLEMYGGGGLVIRAARYDVPADSEIPDSDTDIGLNVKGGMVFGDEYSGLRPFVELDQTIGAGTDTSVRAGVFFTLGG